MLFGLAKRYQDDLVVREGNEAGVQRGSLRVEQRQDESSSERTSSVDECEVRHPSHLQDAVRVLGEGIEGVESRSRAECAGS